MIRPNAVFCVFEAVAYPPASRLPFFHDCSKKILERFFAIFPLLKQPSLTSIDTIMLLSLTCKWPFFLTHGGFSATFASFYTGTLGWPLVVSLLLFVGNGLLSSINDHFCEEIPSVFVLEPVSFVLFVATKGYMMCKVYQMTGQKAMAQAIMAWHAVCVVAGVVLGAKPPDDRLERITKIEEWNWKHFCLEYVLIVNLVALHALVPLDYHDGDKNNMVKKAL